MSDSERVAHPTPALPVTGRVPHRVSGRIVPHAPADTLPLAGDCLHGVLLGFFCWQ